MTDLRLSVAQWIRWDLPSDAATFLKQWFKVFFKIDNVETILWL